MNDQEIIALYWAKEERTISATAEKYGGYCHTIAYNILYDHFEAEECVNDTYLGAWNSNYIHSNSFGAFISVRELLNNRRF